MEGGTLGSTGPARSAHTLLPHSCPLLHSLSSSLVPTSVIHVQKRRLLLQALVRQERAVRAEARAQHSGQEGRPSYTAEDVR